MNENENVQQNEEGAPSTSPPGGKTHEATTPPGNPEPDQAAVEKGQEGLVQAGGGH